MGGFNNRQIASQAGKKSKRGPEKDVKKIRTIICELVGRKSSHFEKWLDKLGEENPERALKIYIQLLEFTLPRLERINEDQIVSEQEHKIDELLRKKFGV